MQRIFLLFTALALVAGAFSCGGSKPEYDAHGDTPTEAYKRLFAAVKSGNADAIRAELTQKSIEFNRFGAKRFGKSEDEEVRFGMTSTTETDTLPQIRDERVKDNMGAIEVWNTKESRWDDLPYVLEDGKWKLAYGDGYAGTWHSPGRGRADKEREAANALRPIQSPVPNVNGANMPPANR